MAELSVKIGADIKELLRQLKAAEKEFQLLSKEAEKAGKSIDEFLKTPEGAKFQKSIDDAADSMGKLEKHAKDLGGEIGDVDGAIGNFKQGLGGLAKQYKVVETASKTSGAAMRSALIATGIGALVVAVGLLVDNWEAITASLDTQNKKIQDQHKLLKLTKDLLDANLGKTQEEIKLAKIRGESTEDLIANEKLLLEKRVDQRAETLKNAKAELLLADARFKSITFFEELAQRFGIDARTQEDLDALKLLQTAFADAGKGLAEVKIQLENFGKGGKELGAFDLLIKKQSELEKELKNSIVAKGADAAETLALASAYKKLSAQIDAVNNSTKTKSVKFEPYKESGIVKRQKKINQEIQSLFDKTITEIEKKATSTDVVFSVTPKFKNFDAIEAQVKELQKLATSIGVDVDLNFKDEKELDVVALKLLRLAEIKDLINTGPLNFKVNLDANLDAFDALLAKVKQIDTSSSVLSDAVSSSFSGMASDISSSLSTGIGAIDGFISSLVGSLATLASEMVASAITEKAVASQKIATNTAVATSAAIAGGAESGAATGPGAIFSIPVMIAALVAVVGAAFASIGGFAKGGFSGDNQLAFLNRNELILRPQEQAGLYNAIRGKNLGSLANNTSANSLTDGIVGEVILRGNTQVIQLTRAKKKMSRYYNS